MECQKFSKLSIASGGDVQNELEGLGVNVFDQGTFEEGVMKQLDEEVSRQTVKQRQRFLIEEYSRVKQERKLVTSLNAYTPTAYSPSCFLCSTLQRELESLSKNIAALLSRPLCDVVLTLREMKSAQEQKVDVYISTHPHSLSLSHSHSLSLSLSL